jgi:hypothetical protein
LPTIHVIRRGDQVADGLALPSSLADHLGLPITSGDVSARAAVA